MHSFAYTTCLKYLQKFTETKKIRMTEYERFSVERGNVIRICLLLDNNKMTIPFKMISYLVYFDLIENIIINKGLNSSYFFNFAQWISQNSKG